MRRGKRSNTLFSLTVLNENLHGVALFFQQSDSSTEFSIVLFVYRRGASVPSHRISAPFWHMDPLSVTSSIIAILQLSGKVLGYLNDVKDASMDRAKCAIEASNLNSLLTNLRFRLEEGSPNERWHTAVRALGVENGPLDQFQQGLEQLQAKMTGRGRLKRAGDALVWKFSKEEVTSILAKMERLKVLVEIALQMDHL